MTPLAALLLASSLSVVAAQGNNTPCSQPQTLTYGETLLESVYMKPGSQPYTQSQYFVYQYNQADLPAKAASITFVVSQLSPSPSNVDLFVISSPSKIAAGCPSYNNFDQSSTNGPPLGQVVSFPATGADATYYIAVSAFTANNNLFSITAFAQGNNIFQPLVSGVPTDGFALTSAQTFYAFTFTLTSSSQAATLDLYAYNGAPDIYVNIASGAAVNPIPNQFVPIPSKANINYIGSAGSNQLIFNANDPTVYNPSGCSLGNQCTVYIGVEGVAPAWGGGVYYVTTASTTSITYNLTDGVPLRRTLFGTNSIANFAYTPLSPANVTFSWTVLGGGLSVQVVSDNGGSWVVNATQSSAVLFLTPADYNPPGSPPYPVFYITVTSTAGPNSTTSFITEAYTSGGGFFSLPLEDGIPIAGISQPHSMAYYTFNSTITGGLEVFASEGGPTSAGKNVYVNYGGVYPQAMCLNTDPVSGGCTYWGADPTTYAFTSEGGSLGGAGAYISVVPGNVPVFTPLIVGVLATEPDDAFSGRVGRPALYTLTAGTGSRLINVQAGSPFPGSVRRGISPGGSKTYGFVPTLYQGDLVITADVTSGSLDLFASIYYTNNPPTLINTGNSFPMPGTATWNSSAQGGSPFRGRSIRIPFTSLPIDCQTSLKYGLAACGLAITAYGNPALLGSAFYTLTASQGGSPAAPTLLAEGNSILLSIPAGTCSYVSAQPESTRGDFGAYILVNNQVGTSTLYVNAQTQSFWQPGQGLIPDNTVPAVGGVSSWRSDRGRATPNLYFVTVCSGAGDVQAEVSYRSSFYTTPLEADVPLTATAYCDPTGCFPNIYSFAVYDPAAPVSFTTYRLVGSETLYISPAYPKQPWVLPAVNNSVWSFYPTFFNPTFTIQRTDPLNTCIPDTKTATPCTYYVAVYGAESTSAEYTITASASALVAQTLRDGQPVSGSVLEYDPNLSPPPVNYYTFTPTSPGLPTPTVSFTWSNYLGAVGLYVTNSYIPGISSLSNLPGPAYGGPCQWTCTNFTACFILPTDPCYVPTGPGGAAVTYTVGVVGMSGTPGANNSYALAGTVAGDPQFLTHGIPTTNIILFPRTNTTFVFDVEAGGVCPPGGGGDTRRCVGYDLFVSASVNHGDVIMMVSPAFNPGNIVGVPPPPPPACTPPAPGSYTPCSGYTWLTNTGLGDNIVYLSPTAGAGGSGGGSGVCNPVTPVGTLPPTVNATSCAAFFGANGALTRGRYYITLYAFALTEMSLLVSDFSRAVPRTILADGQPQLLQTGPITMCPGATRSTVNETCPGGAPSNVTQGAITVFRIPGGSAMTYVNVVIERLCGGNTTGECGSEVYVGVNGCPAGNCTGNQLTPYMGDAAFEEVVWDAVGGLYIPFDACYPPGYAPPLASLAPDCFYAVGVWPRPGGQGSTPGVGVDPATYRITLSTPTGTQRIPQDCPGGGRVCTLPMQAVNPPPALRFYEGYASPNSQTGVTVSISAQLCYGTSITLYACDVTAGSCLVPDRPSSRNADYTNFLSTSGAADAPSTLVLTPWVAGGDVYFFSVGATGGTQPPFDVPTYELSVQHGTGVVLQLAQGTPTSSKLSGSWSGNTYTVSWTLPVLLSGTFAYPQMSNAVFLIDTFLLGSTGTSMHLSSPCGIRYARFQNLTGSGSTFVRQADACGTGTACSFNITWLVNPAQNPVATSWVAVTAVCGASTDKRYSSGPCMPANQESQSVAWTPLLDNPAAPTPIPSPTSSPTTSYTASVSPTPSISPAPAPAPAPKSNSAAVAASVVVVLLLLLGGGGFVAWKYGYAATAYTRLSQMVGGEDRGSSSKAREVLAAHPIFGAGGGEASSGADYTALS